LKLLASLDLDNRITPPFSPDSDINPLIVQPGIQLSHYSSESICG